MDTKAKIRKEQLLARLQEVRASVLAEASHLSAEKQNMVFLGIWSVKDLLAHLVGWDYTNLDAAKSVMESKLPSFYSHRDHDWQTYNAILVKKYKRDSFKELIETVKDSQEKLIEFLHTVPPDDFNKDFGVRFRGYKVTLQRLLEAEAKDEQFHHKQFADFSRESK